MCEEPVVQNLELLWRDIQIRSFASECKLFKKIKNKLLILSLLLCYVTKLYISHYIYGHGQTWMLSGTCLMHRGIHKYIHTSWLVLNYCGQKLWKNFNEEFQWPYWSHLLFLWFLWFLWAYFFFLIFLSGRMRLWVLDCWLEIVMKTLCLGL